MECSPRPEPFITGNLGYLILEKFDVIGYHRAGQNRVLASRANIANNHVHASHLPCSLTSAR